MQDAAKKVIEKYEELETELASPEVVSNQSLYTKLQKQYKGLEKTVAKAREFVQLSSDLKEWKKALGGNDAEFIEAAKEEIPPIEKKLQILTNELQILMVPKEPWDFRNATLEIRAGTGGDESALFAGDLFRMYRGYCDKMGWKSTIQDASEGTVGGYKEIRVFIEGDSVYGTLKFESGVHRVQRVPETETQGRVHTSAATVAILPEAEDVDVDIRDADIHMDTYRSSGAGGQYINKTDSAVRLTHIPTGVVVSCQTERSQLQNRLHAMEMLRSKILDAVIAKKEQAEAASRKALVGTGDRSAKIRTYNYPQNRVTDHRVNLTLYKLESVMTGEIQELIDALQMAHAQEVLGKFA
ncbi:MAG: peptide chain release factor 1 [Fibrobacteraceae bacterium]